MRSENRSSSRHHRNFEAKKLKYELLSFIAIIVKATASCLKTRQFSGDTSSPSKLLPLSISSSVAVPLLGVAAAAFGAGGWGMIGIVLWIWHGHLSARFFQVLHQHLVKRGGLGRHLLEQVILFRWIRVDVVEG